MVQGGRPQSWLSLFSFRVDISNSILMGSFLKVWISDEKHGYLVTFFIRSENLVSEHVFGFEKPTVASGIVASYESAVGFFNSGPWRLHPLSRLATVISVSKLHGSKLGIRAASNFIEK